MLSVFIVAEVGLFCFQSNITKHGYSTRRLYEYGYMIFRIMYKSSSITIRQLQLHLTEHCAVHGRASAFTIFKRVLLLSCLCFQVSGDSNARIRQGCHTCIGPLL